MQDEVIFTEDNGVGVITLNRPDRLNALTYSMVQKINKNLNSWEINDNINCIIITQAKIAQLLFISSNIKNQVFVNRFQTQDQ